jgi:hypothetical protein
MLPLLGITLFLPVFFKLAENNDIQPLIDVCTMGRVAENLNIVFACIEKEANCIVRVMTINQKVSRAAVHFFLCLVIEIFKPHSPDFAVCPSFF